MTSKLKHIRRDGERMFCGNKFVQETKEGSYNLNAVPPPNEIHHVFIDELKDFYPHQMKAYGELIEQRFVAKHNRWRWRTPRKAKGWRKHIRRMKAKQ